MKSRTFFFSGTVLKKDITRFLPVWALYTVFLAMGLILPGNYEESAQNAAAVNSWIAGFGVVNFVYAFVCAGALLGDLCHPRLCNALHALPLRREGWLLTHAAAGCLFSLVPNLLAALASYPLLQEYYFLAFLWLAASTLQFLFFFGLALLCAMCAGNRLGYAAVYGVFNFLVLFFYGIAQALYLPLLRGVRLDWDRYDLLTPVLHLSLGEYLNIATEYTDEGVRLLYDGIVPADWNYLYILGALGLVLTLFSLLLYRRRKLEAAGDFLAWKALSPILQLILTVGAGLIFYLASDIFTSRASWIILLIGMAVGFFVCRMLLERTVRVFRLRPALAFLGLTVLLFGSLFVTKLDPLGVADRIPDSEEVEHVSVYSALQSPAETAASDPEQIAWIRQLHRDLADARNEETEDGSYSVNLRYVLHGGRTVLRTYPVKSGTVLDSRVQEYLSRPEIVLGTKDFEGLLQNLQAIRMDLWNRGVNQQEIWDVSIPESYHSQVFHAILADCRSGVLAQGHGFHNYDNAQLTLVIATADAAAPYRERRIAIYENAEHLQPLLEKIAEEIRPSDRLG